MNYMQAIEYIHKTPKFSRVLGNDMLRYLLSFLDNPHKHLKFIHLAGTNGKGSTAVLTAEILKQAGFKVGLFTSPFIEVFNERIQINGENIKDSDLAEIVTELRLCMENNNAFVSEFALDTAIAFLYFYRQKCDYVVLETGMGGRLDATNVIEESVVSAITSISLDHTQYLGETIEEIAKEKCGIIKENGVVVSYSLQNEYANKVIESVCKDKNATLIKAKEPIIIDGGFLYDGQKYQIGLKGSYQPYNATLAIEIIYACQKQGIQIPHIAIYEGIKNARWIARFEFLRDNLIIDGSHNTDGIRTLKDSLLLLDKKIIIVIGMMCDKDYVKCVEDIASISDITVATEINMERSAKCSDIAKIAENITRVIEKKDAIAAVQTALSLADEDSIICVCGSLYLCGYVRARFCK